MRWLDVLLATALILNVFDTKMNVFILYFVNVLIGYISLFKGEVMWWFRM